MKIEKTPLNDCLIVKPAVYQDDRGIFFESFNQQRFAEKTGVITKFVQDNQSVSKKGVLRGLHLQTGNYAQAKLVYVPYGKILDVVVDLREDSPTFRKSFKYILDDKNHHQLFIPRGFAHGFVTLSESAVFSYKCDNYYHKASEAGIIYNDPTLNIDWEISEESLILSEKDRVLPTLEEFLVE